jgi:acetolactate synthase-1/2/3 large subunit
MTMPQTTGDKIVEFLAAQGVDTVFCITGAGNLAIVDGFSKQTAIKLVFSHHEQASVMEAIGYSKTSGKPGVVLVTTGAGTSNALTGIVSAQMDSVPILLISGNESSFHCETMKGFRAFGVQGFDSVAVFAPVTKLSTRLTDPEAAVSVLWTAWEEMISGRPGAVHIDIPMDIQRRSSVATTAISRVAARKTPKASNAEIQKLVTELLNAKSPMVYIGNGLRGPASRETINRFWNKYKIPMVVSWSAIDLIPEHHEGNFGRVGIYGDRSANIAIQKADLLLCLGTRLAIPQVGYDRNDFARNATKWVVDIDAVELSKNTGPLWNGIHSDALSLLIGIEDLLDRMGEAPGRENWYETLRELQKALPRFEQYGERPPENSGHIHSLEVIESLNHSLRDDCVIVTDVGAGLLSGHYGLEAKEGQTIFTSQGLGEMGFGLPGAIGAYFAAPDRQIVCLNTDGAIMFNLQELEVVRHFAIPIKLFIFNNSGYSMIKISQENLFEGRLAGSSPTTGISFPNFESLAETFGLNFTKVSSSIDLGQPLSTALDSSTSELIEIIMDPGQKYMPRLSTAKLKDGTLASPPIEDLDPKIDIFLLESLLGQRAAPDSYSSRGLPSV